MIDLRSFFGPVFREHYLDSQVWLEPFGDKHFVLCVERGARRQERLLSDLIVNAAAKCDHPALDAIFDEADSMIATMRAAEYATRPGGLDYDTAAECKRAAEFGEARQAMARHAAVEQLVDAYNKHDHTMVVTAVDRDAGTYTIGTCPADPLDVKYDGVSLRNLLSWDEGHRREATRHHRLLTRAVLTTAQKSAVSAYWSAQLRAKIKTAKDADVIQVRVDLQDEE